MKVKFSRCNSNNLTNVPQVDGQLIYVKDTNEVYMDVGETRNKLNDVVEVADIQNLQNPITSKIYYDQTTEKLYKATIENNIVVWKNLSNEEQIFFWDGKTDNTGISFWTNVMKVNKNNDVIVYDNAQPITGTQLNSNVFIEKNYIINNLVNVGYCNIAMNVITTLSNTNTDTELRNSSQVVQLFGNSSGITSIIKRENYYTYNLGKYLRTDANYSEPFVPTNAGHPATKKYVDDTITSEIGNINIILDSINGEVV